MSTKPRNTFLRDREQKRGLDRQRLWEQAVIVAVLSMAILGIAMTGGLSQVV